MVSGFDFPVKTNPLRFWGVRFVMTGVCQVLIHLGWTDFPWHSLQAAPRSARLDGAACLAQKISWCPVMVKNHPTKKGDINSRYLVGWCPKPRKISDIYQPLLYVLWSSYMVWFPEGDGHPTIDTDLDAHFFRIPPLWDGWLQTIYHVLTGHIWWFP